MDLRSLCTDLRMDGVLITQQAHGVLHNASFVRFMRALVIPCYLFPKFLSKNFVVTSYISFDSGTSTSI